MAEDRQRRGALELALQSVNNGIRRARRSVADADTPINSAAVSSSMPNSPNQSGVCETWT